jgi:beta-lactam-binding protein with PASTA domain
MAVNGKAVPDQVPDLVGYLIEDALDKLQKTGYTATTVDLGERSDRRRRILRQRINGDKTIVLVIGNEFYNDPSLA